MKKIAEDATKDERIEYTLSNMVKDVTESKRV